MHRAHHGAPSASHHRASSTGGALAGVSSTVDRSCWIAVRGTGTLGGMRSYPRVGVSRAERARVAKEVPTADAGVAHRPDLRAAGLTRSDVRSEVLAGRWQRWGRHTVLLGTGAPSAEAYRWRAVWESGPGACLDGVAALVAEGLTGFTSQKIDVVVPHGNRAHPVPGVTVRRGRVIDRSRRPGVPRVAVETAALHAAAWAISDRQAALVLCLVLQQRLTTAHRLHRASRGALRQAAPSRRAFLCQVLVDLADGVRALGELDFAGLCRDHGLPPPTRQVVRQVSSGRIYLDAAWEDIGLVVEIDGGQHALALATVHDALRQNEVVLTLNRVLRIPVLGLRLQPDAFLDQVIRLHRLLARP